MLFKLLGCGTSTGVPIPACSCKVCLSTDRKDKRTRASAAIKVNESEYLLIDTSTDLRIQSLTYGIKRLGAVLYTHAHADHILGLDDLRGFCFIQKEAIRCYGTAETFSEIKRCFNYVFDNNHSYKGGLLPNLSLEIIHYFKPFQCLGLVVEPFPLVHGDVTVTGYKFGNIAYATDCYDIPDESRSILKGIDYLILDGLRKEDHKTHFTIDRAVEMAGILGAKKTYLTHMAHTVGYAELIKDLPADVEPGYDGMEVEFVPRLLS